MFYTRRDLSRICSTLGKFCHMPYGIVGSISSLSGLTMFRPSANSPNCARTSSFAVLNATKSEIKKDGIEPVFFNLRLARFVLDFLHARKVSLLNLRFKSAQFPRYPNFASLNTYGNPPNAIKCLRIWRSYRLPNKNYRGWEEPILCNLRLARFERATLCLEEAESHILSTFQLLL